MVAPTSFFSSYGCHVRIAEEADALRALGHQVKVVTYHNGGAWNGLPIERTAAIPWRTQYEVGSSRHKLAFDLLLGMKVFQVVAREHPHIIHAHLHEGALLAFPSRVLTGVPLIFDFQGSLTSEMVDHHFLKKDGWFYKPALRVEKLINNLPDAVIASSQRGVRLLREQFGCRKERILVVPDCVNAHVFRPDVSSADERSALKAQLGIPRERQVVVYLGLLAEYQGTGMLLEAARVMLDAHADLRQQGSFDLADFDTIAADLDFIIDAAQKLQISVCSPPSEIARPMPRPAPVTTATFPSSSFSAIRSSLVLAGED